MTERMPAAVPKIGMGTFPSVNWDETIPKTPLAMSTVLYHQKPPRFQPERAGRQACGFQNIGEIIGRDFLRRIITFAGVAETEGV